MICLRPHHGMCLAYFEGKGYSDGFTVNMQKMLEFFEACGLSEKAQMSFQEFVENVQKNVIESGKRVEICGNCQWNEICANKQSRWKRNK